ncbi:copper resistance CopC family protein [Streptomyces sp. NPDC001927]
MHPRTSASRTARVAARVLTVPLSAVLVWSATVPASAHTDLVSSTPEQGASLDAPPPSIRLTFSDEMAERYAKVALTAPDGTQAGQGGPEVEGKSAILAVKPGLGAGQYTVGYRVVSADGHPVTGSYSFTVKAAPTPSRSASTAVPRPSRSAPPPAAGGASSASVSAPVLALLAVGGALALATAAAVVWRRRRRHDG